MTSIDLPYRYPIICRKTLDFPTVQTAYKSPLAKQIFEVEGVKGVFIADDYVTITKVNTPFHTPSCGDWGLAADCYAF